MKETITGSPLVIDLIFAAIVLIFAFVRGKIGLLHTIVSAVIVIAALAIGLAGSRMLLEPVSDRVWEAYSPKVEARLDEEIEKVLSGAEDIKSSILGPLAGISGSEKEEALTGGELVVKLKTIAMVEARLAVEKICRLILFAVLTIGALLILKVFQRAFKGVGDLPIIRTINHGGGFVLGLVEALVVLIVVIRGAGLIGITFFSEMTEGTVFLSWLAGGDLNDAINSVNSLKEMGLEELKKLDLDLLDPENAGNLAEKLDLGKITSLDPGELTEKIESMIEGAAAK